MIKRSRISRREFLRSGSLAATGLALAACGAAPSSPAAEATQAPAGEPTTAPAEAAAPAAAAEPTPTTAGAPPPTSVEGKVVLWSPGDNGTVADWSQDPILKAVEEATETRIEVVKVGWDTYQDQVNAAIASGQAPDIIATIDHNNRQLIGQWVRDGVVASYDGDVAGKVEQVVQAYKDNPTLAELKIDDKIYMDPVEWGVGNEPNMGLIHIRKDLLDKAGMQPPNTFDQYFAFLAAAKEQGSTGVLFGGQEGLGAAINTFAGAYGVPMAGWVKQGDAWQYWAIQPGTKNALLLFRRMVADGLVDPASWEGTGDARDQYAAGQGASLIFNGGGHIGRIQNDMDLAGKGAKEWLLPALDAGAGSRGYTTEAMFWAATFVTKLEGNKPDDAARVVDFLNSPEGAKLTALGIPGQHYTEQGGEITLLPERAKAGFPTEAGDAGAHPLASAVVSWQPLEWQEFTLLYGKDQEFKDWYKAMRANQVQYQIPSFGLMTTSPLWTEFQSTGGDLMNRAFLEIVRATDENQAASLFDTFVADWKGAGGDAATAEISEALSQIYT